MKSLIMNRIWYVLEWFSGLKKEHRAVGVLVVFWVLLTELWTSPEMSSGINESVPLMVVMGLIAFLGLLELCWWLLGRFWSRMGLPDVEVMVLRVKELKGCQQVMLFWASFALLLLAGLGCIVAVL